MPLRWSLGFLLFSGRTAVSGTAVVNPNIIERPFSSDELAELMGVCRMTVLRQIAAGKIPATKFGRSWRIRADVVRALLNGDAA
jgi:excisionase family DNA binding protein